MTEQILLLVEDSMEDAYLIRRKLNEHLNSPFQLVHYVTMGEAEQYLVREKQNIALVLLDLGLPDTAGGKDTFRHIESHAPDVPVVVLTGTKDHSLALSLVGEGAADFVNKNLLYDKPELLRDAVEFAICRQKVRSELNRKAQETLQEKDMVISWMTGGYSMQPDTDKKKHH
jgi:DNA-binding NtrC family response regulator